MAYRLSVNEAFTHVKSGKRFDRGDFIEDPALIDDVLASEQSHHVVKVSVPDSPPADKKGTKP